jgi:hypothetical protein
LGYVEGKNITIEARYAQDNFDRLPELSRASQVTVLGAPVRTDCSRFWIGAAAVVPLSLPVLLRHITAHGLLPKSPGNAICFS